MHHYKFFQNRECEFFPCHPGVAPDSFNCLFCYCPLYALGGQCGGNYSYTKDGIKDCSACVLPHRKENYLTIQERLPKILEQAKKNSETAEKP